MFSIIYFGGIAFIAYLVLSSLSLGGLIACACFALAGLIIGFAVRSLGAPPRP